MSWKFSRKRNSNKLLQAASQLLVLRYPGELFFAGILLYHLRVIERQMGSAKYIAYCILVFLLGFSLEAVIGKMGMRGGAPGLYLLVFSNLIGFLLEVPSLSTFTVFNFAINDKLVLYLVALRLLLLLSKSSVVAGACGMTAGFVYFTDIGRIRRAQVSWFPSVLRDGIFIIVLDYFSMMQWLAIAVAQSTGGDA